MNGAAEQYAKVIGQFAGLAKRSQQAEWLSDR